MVTQGLIFLLNHAPPSLLLGVISKNGAVPLEASAIAGAGQGSSHSTKVPGHSLQSGFRAGSETLLGIVRNLVQEFRCLYKHWEGWRSKGSSGFKNTPPKLQIMEQEVPAVATQPSKAGKGPLEHLQRTFPPPGLSTVNRKKKKGRAVCSASRPHSQSHTVVSN